MRYKLFALTVLILFLSITIVYGRYSLSIPFHIDTGGLPVSSATVHINISESSSCKTPFYLNKTTAKYGVGQFNVTSSRFIASRTYFYCFNATAGSNKIFGGPIPFQPGVGDINVSRWVNGSSSRFNTYYLNNGSTFDVIYGRQDGNATTAGIANIIYNGTGIKQSQAFNSTLIKQLTVYNNTLVKLTQGFNGTLLKLVNAYNSTLIKRITVFNGTLAKIVQVYNGTLLKNFNNSNRGKTYFNNSVFFNGTITVRRVLLSNGSTFDVIYGRDTSGSFTNGTAINSSGIFANNFFFGNGTSIKSVFVSEDTSNKTWPNVRLIYNNTDILGKFYVNSSIIFNDTVTAYQFRLDNGSTFDVIYGRDTGSGIANNTARNNTRTWANTYFFGNGTDIRNVFVSEDTNNKTWPNRRDILNNTDQNKVYLNSSVFLNDTITANKYQLENGSTFDVIYGRDTTGGISNGSAINGTKIWGNDILFGNLTSIKTLFAAYTNVTASRGLIIAIKNNTDFNKAYLNSSIFINDTLTANKFALENGSTFDVIYGRQGTGVTNNTLDSFFFRRLNLTNRLNILYSISKVNISSDKFILTNGSNFDVVYGNQGISGTGILNNTDQGKVYFNSSNGVFVNGSLTVRRVLLSNGSTFDVIYGRDTDTFNTSVQMRNAVNTSTLFAVRRLNATNNISGYRVRAVQFSLLNGSTFDVIYGRDTSGTGLLNNTDQGKVYINSSNGVFVNGTLEVRTYTLRNGSNFNVIYGRDTDTFNTSSQMRNAVNTSTLYAVRRLNATNNITGYRIRGVQFFLLNGSTFDVIYGRDTTGSFTNGTAINSSGIFANNFFFGNGTSIKSVFVSEDTNNKTWPNVKLFYNNTNQGKIYINSSNGVFVNATLQARKFTLSNGSVFDVIYGRDTTGGLSNGSNFNSTKIWANNYFFGNLTNIKDIFVSEDTNNKTWPNVRLIYNNTDQNKVYINSSVFVNVTLTANKFALENGSVFDVIYGRDTTGGISNGSAINGTKIWGNDILFGNLTSIKSIFVSEDTNNKTWPRVKLLYNATDINGKFYINDTLFSNTTITASFRLLNGSTFDVIYGRDTSGTGILNNTDQGKVYFNSSNGVFVNGTIQVRTYTLRNGSTFDVIYGARPDGNVTTVGITNIIYNGTGVKLVQVYNSTLLKNFNNSNRGKTYFNNSVFFNGTVEGRTFRLRNGTLFDVIYGRDTSGTGILNNTDQGKIYFNSSNGVFVNGTLEVRTYTLRNGSNFNIIYGRDTANVTPAQLTAFVYNGTLPKLTAVFNGTLLKLINAYNGTLLKNFNNSNRGKTYFNNSVFFNGTVEGRTFRLRNGTLFDALYGRDSNVTPAQLTAFIYNNTLVKLTQAFNGTLTKLITVYNGTLAKDKSLVKNNTKQQKLFINYTNINVNGNLTIKGNITLLGAKAGIDCTDVKGGSDSDYCADATGSGLTNNTFDLLTFHRSNFTNVSMKFGRITNRTETRGNNATGWVGSAVKWFQYGFFNRIFAKTQCYTIDCSKYETYNGTHLVRQV